MVGRLFLAVDPSEEARHRLAAALTAHPRPLPGRPVPPENWHLTLRFLGDTDEVRYERLLAGLDQADLSKPFRVGFDGIGAFPRPERATVLWIGIGEGADTLTSLAAQVEAVVEASGWEAEDRPFRPHLTLARIRPHQDVRAVLDQIEAPSAGWLVDAVLVYRSHLGRGGARYELLEQIDL